MDRTGEKTVSVMALLLQFSVRLVQFPILPKILQNANHQGAVTFTVANETESPPISLTERRRPVPG